MHCNVFLDNSTSRMFTADEIFDVITSDFVDYVSDYPKKDWEEAVVYAFGPYAKSISRCEEGFKVEFDPVLVVNGGSAPYGFVVQKCDITNGKFDEDYYGETIGEWIERQKEWPLEIEEDIPDLVITQVFDCHI